VSLAPRHPQETARLLSVRVYLALRTPYGQTLNALATLAAAQLGAPMAMVTLLDDERQYFLAGSGFDRPSVERAQSMCAWTIASGRCFQVLDLLADSRFSGTDVASAGLRFYAGAPIHDPQGLPVGTLCVFDREPRRLSQADEDGLVELAGVVSAQLELLQTASAHAAALEQAQSALSHQARHDALTGLPNRAELDGALADAVAGSETSGAGVAVCFVGLDRFKGVNDSLGHATGDLLLKAVGERLRARLDAGDVLVRFGGDEFVVVRSDLGPDGADGLSGRLRAAFAEPFVVAGAPVSITASIGVAVGRAPQTADSLLQGADAAMQDAKSRGRGHTRVFTPELRSGAAARMRTEAALRGALDRGELVLHYQPVIDLAKGRVVGVEALARWQHPDDGLLMPDAFIPVAEASGLIVPLGAWVLQEATRQAVEWDGMGRHLDMAVNLSVRQVSSPDIVETVEAALTAAGLPAERLLIEVTESAVMEDAEAAVVSLGKIAAMGASVAIDDFGTGYSSLLYLKRYPISVLKVDRSFVSGLGQDSDDSAIVASLISLARAVGAVCIAEGIETETQHQRLVGLGCQLAQGYLFSRPVPASQLVAAIDACEARLAASSPARVPSRRQRRAAPDLPAPVAARIMRLHSDGASLHTIAAALNAQDAPHPEGIRWHATYVARHIASAGAAAPAPWRPDRQRPDA
jgi:diguanylate cyclase (GGDEF)-like protein